MTGCASISPCLQDRFESFASPSLLLTRYQNPVVTAPLGPDGIPMQVSAVYTCMRRSVEGGNFPRPRDAAAQVDERWVQNFYEEFYEDVFEEVAQFGEIENLNVCDNIADHMVGNVYIKFREEEAAAMALQVGGARGACRMASVDHPMQGREGSEGSEASLPG